MDKVTDMDFVALPMIRSLILMNLLWQNVDVTVWLSDCGFSNIVIMMIASRLLIISQLDVDLHSL